jgi:hypothetical protein
LLKSLQLMRQAPSTLCLADSHFITAPTDTPANTAFLQVLTEPGSIGLHAYSDGKTTGGATSWKPVRSLSPTLTVSSTAGSTMVSTAGR